MVIYLQVNGAQVGPFTKDQVEKMYKGGTIHADTLAWADGFSKWMPLWNLITLDALPPRTVPPPMPTRSVRVRPAVRLLMPVGRVGGGMWFLRNIAYLAAFAVLFAPFSESHSTAAGLWALLLVGTYIYLYGINAAKRLHDLNFSALFTPFAFFPLVPLFLLLLSGTKGSNRFGSAPSNEFFS